MGCEGVSVLILFMFQIEIFFEGVHTRKIDLNSNILGKYLTPYGFLSLLFLLPFLHPQDRNILSPPCVK